MPRTILLFLLLALLTARLSATTLPPELKAYDFAEAYYIEDGGVVIWPYSSGFYCPNGTPTPEGIRVIPGQTFVQFNSDRMGMSIYRFTRLDGHRAYFHEHRYRYAIVPDGAQAHRVVIGPSVGTDDFYLTQWRGLEWFDHAFPEVELHPGWQEWRVDKGPISYP